jgi:ribonuclease VapC
LGRQLSVVDASALLAVLLDEQGSDIVIPVLRASRMSAVNLSECCSRAPERGSTAMSVLRAIRRFEITVVPFLDTDAVHVAALREPTRHVGASLGDRACLELARRLGAALFTSDTRLGRLDIGIDIRLIR